LASTDDQLVIAYDKDSLTVELNGVSVVNRVTAASDYFKLQPGSNTITLTGTSIGDGSYATLTYRSGWPLG
jgi:phage-related protein